LERSLVKNAASEKQVKKAEVKELSKREMELNDLRIVLGSVRGRRVFWRLLEHCKVFGTVWEPSAKIHYNSGQQDVGHFLMSEIVQADERYLFDMMRENKKEKENL
jgi:hypothetical protein